MSSLPPNVVGPILQTNLTQRQVSQIRDNERAARASADRQQNNAIDEKDSTVETTDNDTQVHTDAEGAGSQGRAFTPPEDASPDPLDDERPPDNEHGGLIDFEA